MTELVVQSMSLRKLEEQPETVVAQCNRVANCGSAPALKARSSRRPN